MSSDICKGKLSCDQNSKTFLIKGYFYMRSSITRRDQCQCNAFGTYLRLFEVHCREIDVELEKNPNISKSLILDENRKKPLKLRSDKRYNCVTNVKMPLPLYKHRFKERHWHFHVRNTIMPLI